MGSLDRKQLEVCKVEVLAGKDANEIEEEINNKLKAGWGYRDTVTVSNKIYLIFIR